MLYVQFYILHGLPGSGKSIWAENFKLTHDTCSIITLDGLSPLDVKLKTMFSLVSNAIFDSGISDMLDIVIDGMFLTNDEIRRVIDTIEEIDVDYNTPHSYHIKSWEPDEELCLRNCIERHDRNEIRLIRRNPFETIDIDAIRKVYECYIDLEVLHVESDVATQMAHAEEQLQDKSEKLIEWYKNHSTVEVLEESYSSGMLRYEIDRFLDFLLYVDKESALDVSDFIAIMDWYVYPVNENACIWDVNVVGLTEYLVRRKIINISND